MSTTPPHRRRWRRVGRWFLGLVAVALLLVGTYLAPLVYPQPLFTYHARFGEYRVYSDEPLPDDFADVIDETEHRVAAMEHPPHRRAPRVFLCGPRRYVFFARLLRKTSDSLAIGLSATNSVFVSSRRVHEFASINRGRLHHTRFEGNLAEVIAHEIAHFHSLRALGYRPHLAQPLWKSEGWAEYQANLWAIRRDPSYDLGGRIAWLLDDRHWRGGSDLARRLWESQLLVEFLGGVRGYRLLDLVREDVTRAAAREQMLEWYRGHEPGPGR